MKRRGQVEELSHLLRPAFAQTLALLGLRARAERDAANIRPTEEPPTAAGLVGRPARRGERAPGTLTMADESPTPPAPATQEPPGGAPAPEQSPPGAAPAADSSELERLRAENARYQSDVAAHAAVLRVLAAQQGGQQAEQPVQLVRLPPERARRLAQSLGGDWNEQHVQAHVPIFAAFLQELASPILTGIEGMADVVDLVQTRQEINDYKDFSDEVDQLRAEYRNRGQTITRKQAVAAVQSRRMQDPAYVDQLLTRREQEKAMEQQRRAAGAAATITEGGATVQKAGPEPTKQPRAPQSREEFARMTLEEKRKALEGATI